MNIVFSKSNEFIDNKLKCPLCKKLKNKRCFIFNKVKGTSICRMCNRSVGSNKFFIPINERKKDFVGKFSMSNEERKRLYGDLIRQGLSPDQAGRRINYLVRGLRRNFYRKKGLEKIKKMREEKIKQENKELNKKFVESFTTLK